MLKYIQYSRKSSESREKQALSIDDQNKECEEIAFKENLNIVYRFNEAKTAFKPSLRIKFNEMIELINSGSINGILCWKEDRLCRNPQDGGQLLQLLQDGKLQEIRTVAGGTYTPDSDHLILQIHFGMANQYSRNISQNVKRAYRHKVQRGEYPRPAFYGYENFGERGRRNIRPHPFEAPIIIELFKLTSSGQYSLGHLESYIYKKGLRTKYGNRIMKSTVYSILTNSAYYGNFCYNEELYKGDYVPLVSKNLFDRVQNALHLRSKPKHTNKISHPYNGLFQCYECGAAITTTIKAKYYKRTKRKAIYTYHHCTKRKGKCSQEPITNKSLESEIINQISKITIDKKTWDLGIGLLKQKHKEQSGHNLKQLEIFENKYKKLQEKLNRLIDMRADGELSKKEFMLRKKFLLEEQAQIENIIKDTKNSSLNWLELAEKFLDTSFYARKILESDDLELKRELILSVGQNLFLKDKKAIFSFKKPFDMLLKPLLRTDVLRTVDNVRTNIQQQGEYVYIPDLRAYANA